MVVGASGLGKSTLLNTMFQSNTELPGPTQQPEKTVKVEANRVLFEVTK